METEGNHDDFMPFSLLSPSVSSSGSEIADEGSKAAPLNEEGVFARDGNKYSAVPSAHLEFLNLIFPPTPEKSPSIESCQDEEVVVMETTATSTDGSESGTQIVKDSKDITFKADDVMNTIQKNENSPTAVEENVNVGSSPLKIETAGVLDEEEYTVSDDSDSLQVSGKNAFSKGKRSLTFPPCVICSGKATGSHYGAITCEACKGFFRRYLQKREEYKCTRGGRCEIINRNRGNCSGCRLRKCLALGMSKEKSKLGRYTLTKRTEAIKNMNKLQGKPETESAPIEADIFHSKVESECTVSFDPESEMIGRNISQNSKNLNTSNGFTAVLVPELVQAMNEIMPYGPDVKTKEHVQERHRFHAERYKQLIQMFGQMNTVPKEEYDKLYKGYGIDIDGRMAAMKTCCRDLEGIVERYCNFAKHIPGFYRLPYKDQSTLLKVSRADFFIITNNDAFSQECGTFLGQDGRGYHIEEVADRFLSRELVLGMCDVYSRWQKLEMTEEEQALVGALTLVFTDRCKLENRAGVEKIQLALVDLIRNELQKKNKATARKRFTSIIDTLTSMRNVSELYLKEFNILCKDDIIAEEFPMLLEFFLEEYDTAKIK